MCMLMVGHEPTDNIPRAESAEHLFRANNSQAIMFESYSQTRECGPNMRARASSSSLRTQRSK